MNYLTTNHIKSWNNNHYPTRRLGLLTQKLPDWLQHTQLQNGSANVGKKDAYYMNMDS